MEQQLPTVHIYTDGACKGNPGVGGWGAWLKSGDHEKELFGGEKMTTNNQMELTAVIRALQALKKTCNVHIYTDSQYVKNGITEWISKWKGNGWKTSSRSPVKNVTLWQTLDLEVAKHNVTWHWVKGHDGSYGNEKADALANSGVLTVKD